MRKNSYFFEEEEEDSQDVSIGDTPFECEMNYGECNRRGYCNGDC